MLIYRILNIFCFFQINFYELMQNIKNALHILVFKKNYNLYRTHLIIFNINYIPIYK